MHFPVILVAEGLWCGATEVVTSSGYVQRVVAAVLLLELKGL